MIQIDKTDFLYKRLTKLGSENIEEDYQEFAQNGINNATDFLDYLMRQYGDDFSKELDEETLEDLLPFYLDSAKTQKTSKKDFSKVLKEYKQNPSKIILEQLANSKFEKVMLISALYKNKMPQIDIEDILQTCNIGLLKAIEKYDVNAKISFENYMEFWIYKEIKSTYFKEKNNG